MDIQFHSVTLEQELCKGCTICIKRCPTEAIRVRAGKAHIRDTRCIDCGECIRNCPNHAKVAVADQLERLKGFRYTIAIPAPSLYGQFKTDTTIPQILTGLTRLGFDTVFEAAESAEFVSLAIRRHLKTHPIQPLISSSCPAVVRLIQVRFPGLLDHLIPMETPMELAAKMAKQEAQRRTGLPLREIGAFFISPCPAKVTAVKQPVGATRSEVDGVLSIAGIYGDLLKRLPPFDHVEKTSAHSGIGVGWARSGGENRAIAPESCLAVDGIHNVITVLDEIERGRLRDIVYFECLACVGGCVGGPLTVENPFVARVRIRQISEKLGEVVRISPAEIDSIVARGWFNLEQPIPPRSIMQLDDNMVTAMAKLEQLEAQALQLPGLDCGACGSPSCHALAEDIVQGEASEMDCVIKLREKLQVLAQEMLDMARRVPKTMTQTVDEATRQEGPA